MMQICIRNLYTQTRPMLQPTLVKQLSSNLQARSLTPDVLSQRCGNKTRDKNLELIYYGPLTPQIKMLKVFSQSCSVAGLIAQPTIIREAAGLGSTGLLVALCSVVGFFSFVTPILMHGVTKKYVTKIHYDPTTLTYKASTINFFLAEKEMDFKLEDVVVPETPGMFTTLEAKGKSLFIDAKHFNSPEHFARMMGHDEPMDLKPAGNAQMQLIGIHK